MIIRDLNYGDEPALRHFLNGQFPFPDLTNELYISKKVVINEGNQVGAGVVRLTSEGLVILDPTSSRRQRVSAVSALIDSQIKDVKAQGMDECHVFVRELNVRRFLKHLGFKDSLGGDPMIIHF